MNNYSVGLSSLLDVGPKIESLLTLSNKVLLRLKHTFLAAKSESTFQSMDEAMSKFKGRSSLKQYLLLKPIKTGVKWVRCDSKTGYTYDLNIYSGKDADINQSSTLREDVVLKLAGTIREIDVSLCFDRFFTSSKRINELPFAVGEYINNHQKKHTKVRYRKITSKAFQP